MMDSSAKADPEAIERFADSLTRFNLRLADSLIRLRGRYAALSESWRDQEHLKFAQEFEQTLRAMNRFAEVSKEQVPVLKGKATLLREYLNSGGRP